MRPTRTSPQNLSLEELLDDIHRGMIALPDFQRDFDWSERDVQSLLVTVLTGWPIGSLLLMSGRPEYLELRKVEGGPEIPPRSGLTYVILDGQQRMTSLYQALYDRGPYAYAIYMPSLGEGTVDELEESVRYFKRDKWEDRYGSAASQWSDGLLPISALRSASDFFEWRDLVLREESTGPSLEKDREHLTESYREVLSGVHRYQVPAVSLPHTVPPRAVARIFERVNRTGMPLDAFDLAVARSFTGTWNLRRQFERAREEYPLIEHYLGERGLPILQSISLRESENVRESAVIDLPGDVIRKRWDSAVNGMVQALEFIRSVGFVPDNSFLPYGSLLVVLAALAQDSDLAGKPNDALRAWYWGTILTQSYDVASNTRSVADYKSLRDRVSISALNYQRRVVARDAVRTATKKSSGALWRGFVCFLLGQPALSFLDGSPVFDPDELPGESEVHTTSLWPRKKLQDLDEEPPHLRALSMIVGRSAATKQLGGGGLLRTLAASPRHEHPDDLVMSSQLLPPAKSYDYGAADWIDLIDLRSTLFEELANDVTDAVFAEYEPSTTS